MHIKNEKIHVVVNYTELTLVYEHDETFTKIKSQFWCTTETKYFQIKSFMI